MNPDRVHTDLVDVEIHTHLVRVEQAGRMWRAVADRLRELSDSLRHELDCLSPQWTDSTGERFVGEVVRRKTLVDEMLSRLDEHRPWRALDDLARQLELTHARMVGGAGWMTATGQQETTARLAELGRYFQAASDAVLAAAGDEPRLMATTVDGVGAGNPAHGCCPSTTPLGPTLAGAPAGVPAPSVLLDPAGGAGLPPGSVALPGLIAVPPGAAARGGHASRPGAPGSAAPDPRSSGTAGVPFDASAYGSSAGFGGSAPPDSRVPERIEQVAEPVPITESEAVPQAPQPPERMSGAGGASPSVASGAGRMFPPMMMPPMMPTAGRAGGRRSGTAQPLDGGRRRVGKPTTPGVPARLRGRSAVANPTASGYRPIAMADPRSTPAASAAEDALDHEVWQVTNPGSVSPLKPEAVQPDQVRGSRRPRPRH
ncbi:hypothetical protein [Saccharomonospora cyanea]|uniref:Uncharacterized protein n=1 Tax=Saccharomonospora cyanea NA-134 TaxID=882082 RepID=H5XNM2_9PSEU|nr:hypothetical protein [Saccharomonospora cyanea]EHR61083.1 hypothetical protein SaccyDRAFT_2198 [Saccharomonospora cyanea NA-134]